MFSLFYKMFSFPLRNDRIKKGGARPPFNLLKMLYVAKVLNFTTNGLVVIRIRTERDKARALVAY